MNYYDYMLDSGAIFFIVGTTIKDSTPTTVTTWRTQ